jgi:hypothetical protein
MKKARYTNIRLPATVAPLFFELTKTLGFKRDGMTVEWLIQQSESDQDPHKFASADELLINGPEDESMMTPPWKRRRGGRTSQKTAPERTGAIEGFECPTTAYRGLPT